MRLALGATARDIVGTVLRQGMAPAMIGVMIGLAGAAVMTRRMTTLLFGILPLDPATFAAVAGLLLAAALVACGGPARRAIARRSWRCLEGRMTQWLDELRADARHAVRQLLATPAFTLVAATTLAIGIGATATIFSVVDAVILQPLPFAEPERVVIVGEDFEGQTCQRVWRQLQRLAVALTIVHGIGRVPLLELQPRLRRRARAGARRAHDAQLLRGLRHPDRARSHVHRRRGSPRRR